MSNRLENPTKHALELQDNIIESAKILQKHRSLLRLALAGAEKNKTYRHVPGKDFTTFVEYLKFLAPKTNISVKRMRKLAKAGAVEELLNEAGINTVNMSDIALITLGQNVPKEQVVNVYRKAVTDNNLVKNTPSQSQIIKAAKKLGVFKQKTSKAVANNRSSSKDHATTEKTNATLENVENEKLSHFGVFEDTEEAEEEDTDDEVYPLSRKSRKSKVKGLTTPALPKIKPTDQAPKSNGADVVLLTPRLIGKEIASKFTPKDAKAMVALISKMSELFAEFDGDKNIVDEGMRILKQYPLNQWGELSESISRVINKNARFKINQERTARNNKVKKRRRDERLEYLRKRSA